MKYKCLYPALLSLLTMCGKKDSSSNHPMQPIKNNSDDVREMFLNMIDKNELTPSSSDSDNPQFSMNLVPTELHETIEELKDSLKDFVTPLLNLKFESDEEEENYANTQPTLFSQWDTGFKVFLKNSDKEFVYYYFNCLTVMPKQPSVSKFSKVFFEKQIEACSQSAPGAKMQFETGEKSFDEDGSRTSFLGQKDTNGPCEFSFQNGEWQPTSQCGLIMSSNYNSPHLPFLYIHSSTDGLSPEGNGLLNLFFYMNGIVNDYNLPLTYSKEETLTVTNGSI